MKIVETVLPGVLIIQPKVHADERGFFLETFQIERYREAGVTLPFVQDNHSRSTRGVLRGMHFQRTRPQGKLVWVSRGAVLDVAVDVDPASPTFGRYSATLLDENNHHQHWIPPGYAHGFCTIGAVTDLHYKCTDLYRPDDEAGFVWNDPDVAIPWPVATPVLSHKDAALPRLRP